MGADELTWNFDEFFWTASTVFPVWAGYRYASGPYGSPANQTPSDGHVKLVFAPGRVDDSPPSPDELKLVQWVLDNAEIQAKAVLREVLAGYPPIRDEFSEIYLSDGIYSSEELEILLRQWRTPTN